MTLSEVGDKPRVKLGNPVNWVVALARFEYGLRFPAASVARTW